MAGPAGIASAFPGDAIGNGPDIQSAINNYSSPPSTGPGASDVPLYDSKNQPRPPSRPGELTYPGPLANINSFLAAVLAGSPAWVSGNGTKVINRPPSRCPSGHLLGPNQVLVGHVACLGHGGGGHTSWHYRTCDAVVYGPPLNTHCTTLERPATARISNT
jgi:hypothetical protein